MLFGNKREDTISVSIKEALRSWQDAQKYFDSVSDPDLVDVAIYDIEAARRRYMYLLKCVKQGRMIRHTSLGYEPEEPEDIEEAQL